MPYSGDLIFKWLPDGINMSSINELVYTVPSTGEYYIIPKGYKTDGASIPRYLWSAEGSPFTGKYRDAAVIHDYLCSAENDAREEVKLNGFYKDGTSIAFVSWQKACAIFHEAMLEAGCSKFDACKKATGVYLFGPHWKKGSCLCPV